MKVLITGGCGFLGSNVAASFIAQGAEVVVVDALLRIGASENWNWLQSLATEKQCRLHRVDTADAASIDEVFRQESPIEYVCHLAGQVAMTTSLEDPRRDFMTNAFGTFNIIDAIRRFSKNAFLAYSSTNKVYGDLLDLRLVEKPTRYEAPDHPNGLDESLPLDFATPYGCSKGSADQYVRDSFRCFGLKTIVFRHSSIYGGRQYSTYDQGWVGWFCRQVFEQNRAKKIGKSVIPFTISGTGKQVRDLLHADDLTNLYRCAYEQRDKVAGEVFNIGGGVGNSLSLLELFRLIQETYGMSEAPVFRQIERRKSDQDYFVADIRKAKELLGWDARVNKENGVARMLDWVESISQ